MNPLIVLDEIDELVNPKPYTLNPLVVLNEVDKFVNPKSLALYRQGERD